MYDEELVQHQSVRPSVYHTPVLCIRQLVSATVFQPLVTALVLSRLDYGNGTLIGLPIHLIRRLQSV